MARRFPVTAPFRTGFLSVGDRDQIYWEASGNPSGKPALYLHGGPGGGLQTGYRRHFDPERYCIVSFEQRGCGRSRPLATDPKADLASNTTPNLIADIEELRVHLGIERWLVCGVSWGTTLALAYAQAHPDRVSEIALAAVTTTGPSEVEWTTEGMRRLLPREWDAFAAAVPRLPGQRLIDAYHCQITSPEPEVRAHAARAWCTWENAHMGFAHPEEPHPGLLADAGFQQVFATLVIHYWANGAFLQPGALLAGMPRLAHLPGVLIHGRLDVSCPTEIPWDLHRSWPGSEFIVIPDEGHGGVGMFEAIARTTSRWAERP